MAKIEMKGLDRYTKALSHLEARARAEVIGKAIFDGADVVADEIRAGMEALPTEGGRASDRRPLIGPNPVQKKHLISSFGIAPMKETDGFYHVKMGWAGYNPIRTIRWPAGQPNAMVARSVERGTSFMQANPFVKKAVSRARKKSIAAMQARIDERLHTIFENGTQA